MQRNTHKFNKPEELVVAVVVVVVVTPPPVVTPLVAPTVGKASSPLAVLDRTANILPSFVRI